MSLRSYGRMRLGLFSSWSLPVSGSVYGDGDDVGHGGSIRD